ncbi:MAG: helix-turn-helix transcriptional regulator [Chitinophagaceae bacterium]|nr:helix-turn-helix transcriptional regulator [Chitinophagaceae bacterium]
MEIKTFLPSDILKPYVKCYWIYTVDKENSTEVLYPGGYIEIAINIASGNLTTIINDRRIGMPNIEVLGQLTSPAKVVATTGITLLVTRFYPYTASVFFPNQVSDFTNDSIDLNDVFSSEAIGLYNRMMQQDSITDKIDVLEFFLIQKLRINEKKLEKLKLVNNICDRIDNDCELFKIENVASYYGFSERFIQKLFLDFIGITPKSFFNIRRFRKSLQLVQSSFHSLTSIAYECGYYDQSHFIKEFKTFSGVTPSHFRHTPIEE